MNWRQRVFLISFLLPCAGLSLNPAHAQTRVGEAVLVQNQVARVAGSLTMPISVGDGLLRDETVRTGAESAARLVMADSTNLSIGPNASITLDRTVFNDEHSYREIAIKLATGAFRFVTGHSEKAAYTIRTPVASIGVRGTVLDILSQQGKTTVVLQDGASRVCAIGGACTELTNPGDTAIITLTGGGNKPTIKKTGSSPWSFAANCAASPGLCSVTQFADAGPQVPAAPVDTAALCGR
ncbi:MAG TPA: FecR domain-containing protein [Bradyrhizobium sp.]|uniref:FecR family protein n=1 Tax=Bradyrhizobium sp. TaxID=376 RepID=UPI002D80489A|nr:FecR domain-containing protein [Bradyrhizobium sp.]HET7886030.1 FecR domain-containing protein [Bradyrhizobium sp.]